MERFFGLYRGTVVNNIDPMAANRLQVAVPGVLGYGNSWAMVSAALGGGPPQAPVGSTVWVMFEAGNPANPVVMGGMPAP